MKENVQAHQGQVTFLRVSNSFVESPDNLASRDHLVSCGTDCTVRIWQLIRPEINRVSIQQVALVKLLQSPRDLAMAGNTLCMAMADNNVIMCRLIFSFFFFAERRNIHSCFPSSSAKQVLLQRLQFSGYSGQYREVAVEMAGCVLFELKKSHCT